MKLIIPGRYRGGKLERMTVTAYRRLLYGDTSHMRPLYGQPHIRRINVTTNYRLFSRNYGITWKLFNHRDYERQIQKWRK
ncbi:hypothetical protein ABM310_002263 [Salmonella enterica]